MATIIKKGAICNSCKHYRNGRNRMSANCGHKENKAAVVKYDDTCELHERLKK